MLEKFRSLSFNKKLAIAVSVIVGFVLVIFAIAIVIKLIIPSDSSKLPTPNETSNPNSIVTVTPTPAVPADNAPYNNKPYGSFTEKEVYAYTSTAQSAATKLCLKSEGETSEVILSRLKQYFSDSVKLSSYIANSDILERKCILFSSNAISIDTDKNTILVEIKGSSYSTPSSQASTPASERNISQNNAEYIFLMAKDSDGTIKVIKID